MPLSSISDVNLIDPLNDLDLGTVEVLDLTNTGDIVQTSTYETKTTEGGFWSPKPHILWLTFADESFHAEPVALDLDDNQWEVEELQGRRKVGRGFQYFVKWVGDTKRTWQRKGDINPKLVKAYDALNPFH
jgi:hypothetical protein